MPNSQSLYFKDAVSAFEYACKFTPSEVVLGQKALGIVILDTMDKSGRQALIVRLADSALTEIAGIPISPKLNVKVGDLVICRIEKTLTDVPAPFNTFGVVGAKVAPEWSIEAGWRLINVPGVYVKESFAVWLRKRIGRIFRETLNKSANQA